MKSLKLIAGKTARQRIEEQGLSPDLVRLVLGASGGPKWLVLLELDKLIFGRWLPKASGRIDLLGSSIGAWRMTNAAHPDPATFIERFVDLYFQFRKEDARTPEILTRASYKFLDELFAGGEAERIATNALRNLNVVTVRAKGLKEDASKWKEGAEILASAGANAFDRAYLARFFDRVVFYTGDGVPCPASWPDFERTDVKLTADTLADVLLATGSIPFVSNPIKNIAGAPAGIYRDGGVIDYHFDVPWNMDGGIVLYPHFYSHIVPGWFDKHLTSRRAKGATWDQILMLAPSEEFVSALPGGKIPERANFTDMDDKERLAYWTIVIKESERLAEEFSECLAKPHLLMDRLEAAPQ